MEGVGTMFEHEAREGTGGGLGTKVSEHGIRLPTAQEHDVVCVHVGTEEGGSTTRAKGATGNKRGFDACFLVHGFCCYSKGSGDGGGGSVVPAAFAGVVVGVDRGGGSATMFADVHNKAAEGFDRTEMGVSSRGMTDLFALDSILLVSKGERGASEAIQVPFVIQRYCHGREDGTSYGEADVLH